MYVTFWKIVGTENWSVIVEVGGGTDIKGHEGILGGDDGTSWYSGGDGGSP